MPLFKNFYIWKMSFLNFLGALGGPLVKKFSQNGSKGLVTPEIKNSLPFKLQKIPFKMIY